MIYFKTEEEIDFIRNSCLLVSRTLAEIALYIQPGITTEELDRIAETFIIYNGGKPGFLGYQGYPKSLCISVNDVVLHGIPSEQIIQDGDLVSIDCGVLQNGFYGDACYTFLVGNVPEEARKLCKVTKEALQYATTAAIEENRLGDIGYAVQSHASENGFSVIREFSGHGLGRNLHEDPSVTNYGKRGHGEPLKRGLVIAIEPLISAGNGDIIESPDGWTIKTLDGALSAHYEHTLVVRPGKAELLSTFQIIEEAIKKNKFLWQNSLQ